MSFLLGPIETNSAAHVRTYSYLTTFGDAFTSMPTIWQLLGDFFRVRFAYCIRLGSWPSHPMASGVWMAWDRMGWDGIDPKDRSCAHLELVGWCGNRRGGWGVGRRGQNEGNNVNMIISINNGEKMNTHSWLYLYLYMGICVSEYLRLYPCPCICICIC